MPVNDKIRTVEYNTIQARIAKILGGSSTNPSVDPDYGYGQTVQSSQVGTSNRVTINEWGLLRYDIINVYTHQVGTAPSAASLPNVTEGTKVRYSVSDAPVTVWDTLSTTLQNNRFTVSGLQAITTNVGPYSFTGAWVSQATWEGRMLFSNISNAYHFFNSGGLITFNTTFTPSNTISPKSQETSWQNLLTATGDVSFGGAVPNTGITPDDGKNFHRLNLTGSYGTFSTSTASSPYGANTVNFDAAADSGNLNDLKFRIRFVDAYTDPALGEAIYPPTDGVDGTLQVYVTLTIPSQTLQPPSLSETWQVETPTISQLSFTAS